jgi:hypothetical protein
VRAPHQTRAAACSAAAFAAATTPLSPSLSRSLFDADPPSRPSLASHNPQLLQAGGAGALAADPAKLQAAVAFAAATGALTCARPGAIGSQPELEEVERLVAKAAAAGAK